MYFRKNTMEHVKTRPPAKPVTALFCVSTFVNHTCTLGNRLESVWGRKQAATKESM